MTDRWRDYKEVTGGDMKQGILAWTCGAAAAVICTCAGADGAASIDVSKLKATNTYTLLPQDRIFIEFTFAQAGNTQGDLGPDLIFPPVMLGDAIAKSTLNADIYAIQEADSGPIHAVFDGYDSRGLLREGTDKELKSLVWLHASKNEFSAESDTNQFLLWSPNATADSVITTRLYYSLTPDYRGLVVSTIMKLYSSVLSPNKYSPYDPDSKFYWLKQPVAIRVCVYQSKLLQLPEKTPALVDQLAALLDKRFDAPGLKRDIEQLNKDPYSTDSVEKRTRVAAKEQAYEKYLKDVRSPTWQYHDSRMMLAVMWTAGDGALLKQALRDGTDSLPELVGDAFTPKPIAGTSQPGDPPGLAVVGITPERRTYLVTPKRGSMSAVVMSFATGDPADFGVVAQLYSE